MVNSVQAIKVTINNISSALIPSGPVTLKNSITVPSLGEPTLLTQLSDVDSSQEQDGSVLQYVQSTNNYVIKPLVIGTGDIIDAGTF